MTYQLAMIDFDGTLVEFETDHVVSELRRILALHGVPAVPDHHVRACLSNATLHELVPEHIYPDFGTFFSQHYDQDSSPAPRLIRGVKRALYQLKASGIELVLVTDRNMDRGVIRRILDQSGVGHYFAAIFTRRDYLGSWSGKELCFRSIMERFQIEATNCITVGDQPDDALSATNTGIGFNVLVESGGICHDVLSSAPCHRVITTLCELPAALEEYRAHSYARASYLRTGVSPAHLLKSAVRRY